MVNFIQKITGFVFTISTIITPIYRFPASKNLGLKLALSKSMQCDRRKSIMIFASGKFSEIGSGTVKGTDYSVGHGIKT